VIHNVDPEKTQAIVANYVKEVKEYVMSIEPYPQGDGYHLHLFVAYRNQRSFQSVLKELQALSKQIQTPRPEGETRDWGRVQLDVMRGTFKDCVDYLQGVTKDKPLGEVKEGKKYPGELIQRMIALAVFRYYHYDEPRPVLIDEYDDEYGEGFCDACYEKWHDYVWSREFPE